MFIKKTIFLIFCTVFVVSAAFSQKKVANNLLRFSVKPLAGKGFGLLPADSNITMTILPSVRPTLVSPSFSTAHWGFFCKQELKLEKAIKIPLRFRLGSVVQCDRMEGKRVALTQ